MDNNSKDACIISQPWLSPNHKYAYVPNVSGNRFHRVVWNQESVPVTTAVRPVTAKTHKGDLYIVKQGSILLSLAWV